MASRLSLGQDDSEFLFESDSDGFSSTNEAVLDTLTRIGGEVSRLRAEVDSLLEQNMGLLEMFTKLKEVIADKSLIHIDEFDLVCDSVTKGSSEETRRAAVKKIAH